MKVNDINKELLLVSCEYRPFPGGIATYSYEIVNAALKRGYSVKVVAPEYEEYLDSEKNSSVRIYRYLKHHKISIRAFLKLLMVLLRTSPDTIVLASDIRSVLALYLLKPIHQRKYISMVHGSEASKFSKYPILHYLLKRAYLSSVLVAFNSKFTQNLFVNHVGTHKNERVTYLGVESTWYNPPLVSETSNDLFESKVLNELPSHFKCFVSLGRVEPRKGQLETIKAIGMANKILEMDNLYYIVVGRAEEAEFDYTDQLEVEAKRSNVKLIRPGRISENDIKILFGRSFANVLFAQPLPGKVEGFGLVLLEAAAQRCPSIGAASGGIPEVLGTSGTLVAPDNIEELSNVIIRYATDEEFRLCKSDGAYNRALEFSWDNCFCITFSGLLANVEEDVK